MRGKVTSCACVVLPRRSTNQASTRGRLPPASNDNHSQRRGAGPVALAPEPQRRRRARWKLGPVPDNSRRREPRLPPRYRSQPSSTASRGRSLDRPRRRGKGSRRHSEWLRSNDDRLRRIAIRLRQGKAAACIREKATHPQARRAPRRAPRSPQAPQAQEGAFAGGTSSFHRPSQQRSGQARTRLKDPSLRRGLGTCGGALAASDASRGPPCRTHQARPCEQRQAPGAPH